MLQFGPVTLRSNKPQPSRSAGSTRMGSIAKVFILCVNRLLRESIARILTKRTDFEIVTAQVDRSTSCEQVRDAGADVLVLDSLDFLLDSFGSPSAAGRHDQSVKSV